MMRQGAGAEDDYYTIFVINFSIIGLASINSVVAVVNGALLYHFAAQVLTLNLQSRFPN